MLYGDLYKQHRYRSTSPTTLSFEVLLLLLLLLLVLLLLWQMLARCKSLLSFRFFYRSFLSHVSFPIFSSSLKRRTSYDEDGDRIDASRGTMYVLVVIFFTGFLSFLSHVYFPIFSSSLKKRRKSYDEDDVRIRAIRAVQLFTLHLIYLFKQVEFLATVKLHSHSARCSLT